METITKKIIKLIEERENLLPNEVKEYLTELKEEIKQSMFNINTVTCLFAGSRIFRFW